MAATVAGTFEDQAGAQWAVERLRAAGIPTEEISLIVRHPQMRVASGDTEAPVRGGAATTAVNTGQPVVDPGLVEQMLDDTVEPVTVEEYSATESGAAAGGLIGALSGFLVGLGVVGLPGLGLIVAAGPLAAALGGTAIGTATGGLIGALVDAGLPEEYASTYAHHVERGHVLLTVQTDAAAMERVRDILVHAGASSLYPGAGRV
jgi:hypothetical protein